MDPETCDRCQGALYFLEGITYEGMVCYGCGWTPEIADMQKELEKLRATSAQAQILMQHAVDVQVL